jgi:hypothetical protein
MHNEMQDCFVVFLRDNATSVWRPELAERPVAACASYAEAVRVRKQYRLDGKACIIRCVSQTGGSD